MNRTTYKGVCETHKPQDSLTTSSNPGVRSYWGDVSQTHQMDGTGILCIWEQGMYFIYLITCRINGKVYCGKTIQAFVKRWQSHKAQLNSGKHGNRHLQHAWKKYGADAFAFEVWDTAESEEEMDVKEAMYIDMLNLQDKRHGFNLKAGGPHGCHSPETRRKISKGNKGKILTPEHRANISKGRQGIRFGMKQLEKMRNAQAQTWSGVISPSGVPYTDVVNLRKFAREHGLDNAALYAVAKGNRKSHKGWTRYIPPEQSN